MRCNRRILRILRTVGIHDPLLFKVAFAVVDVKNRTNQTLSRDQLSAYGDRTLRSFCQAAVLIHIIVLGKSQNVNTSHHVLIAVVGVAVMCDQGVCRVVPFFGDHFSAGVVGGLHAMAVGVAEGFDPSTLLYHIFLALFSFWDS